MKKLVLALVCLLSVSAFAEQVRVYTDASYRAQRGNFSYDTVYRVNAQEGTAYGLIRINELFCGSFDTYPGHYRSYPGYPGHRYPGRYPHRPCSYDSVKASVPGLSFNKDTEDIVFDNGSSIVVCANTYIGGRIFRKRIIKPTGNCKFTTKREVETVDNGRRVRRQRVVNVYFEAL
jgi:hypothetical protein